MRIRSLLVLERSLLKILTNMIILMIQRSLKHLVEHLFVFGKKWGNVFISSRENEICSLLLVAREND